MAREKGLVVDCNGKRLTVVTRDGRFQTFDSREDVLIGEEVFIPPIKRSAQILWLMQKRVVPAIAIASLLVFISFFGYNRYLEARPTMAYVSLDLAQSGGSIELEVNDKGLVRNAASYDETGKKALSEISYKMKPVEKVAQEFISKGATSTSSGLIIGVVPAKDTPEVGQMEQNLRNTLTKTASQITASRSAQTNLTGPSGGTPGGGAPGSPSSGNGSEKPIGGTGTEPPKKANGKGFEIQLMKIDMETRAMAQELGISSAKAVIWALAESLEKSLGQLSLGRPEDTAQTAVGSSKGSDKPGVASTQPGSTQGGSTGQGKGHSEHSGSPKGEPPALTPGAGKGQPGSAGQGGSSSQGKGSSTPPSQPSGVPAGSKGSGSGTKGPGDGQSKGTPAAGQSPSKPSGSSPSLPWKASPFPTKDLGEILKAAAEKDTKALQDLTRNLLEGLRRSMQQGGRGGGVRFIRASAKPPG